MLIASVDFNPLELEYTQTIIDTAEILRWTTDRSNLTRYFDQVTEFWRHGSNSACLLRIIGLSTLSAKMKRPCSVSSSVYPTHATTARACSKMANHNALPRNFESTGPKRNVGNTHM